MIINSVRMGLARFLQASKDCKDLYCSNELGLFSSPWLRQSANYILNQDPAAQKIAP